ncbi:MAG: response regulator [Gemmatimonadetes bacterium]|nr:response regulator [Gemmatimonadota bacterium]
MRPVLLVEDNPDYALLVQLAFSQAGVTNPVRVLGDGEAAIAYLSGLPPYDDRARYPHPALMITDLRLPKRSGLELLEWIRDRREFDRLPVVVLTSSTDPNDEVRAYQLGARFYVVKPMRVQALVLTVRAFAELWLGASPQRRGAVDGAGSA